MAGMTNAEWLASLYERCRPGINQVWARGYACGLKDAGVITTKQLVDFLEWIEKN